MVRAVGRVSETSSLHRASTQSSPLQHSATSLQPLQVNNDLIPVKSIPCCQPTIHACQKTLNPPLYHVCCTGGDYLYWTSRAWRLRRQADPVCLLDSGRASLLLIAAFCLSVTHNIPHGRCRGRDEGNRLGEKKAAVC